jgi:beta-phosphoglucomutase-like phosphatase (HAD superfamily)
MASPSSTLCHKGDSVYRIKSRPPTRVVIYPAACALDAPPAGCLAFEDSLTGLRSAVAAGLRTVGIPSLPDGAFPADVVFTSLQDAALTGWMQRW